MFKVNYAGRICLNNEKPVNANVAHQLIDHEGAVAKLIYELNQQYPNLNLVNNKQEVHRIVIAAHPNIASKSVSSRLGCGNIFFHIDIIKLISMIVMFAKIILSIIKTMI